MANKSENNQNSLIPKEFKDFKDQWDLPENKVVPLAFSLKEFHKILLNSSEKQQKQFAFIKKQIKPYSKIQLGNFIEKLAKRYIDEEHPVKAGELLTKKLTLDDQKQLAGFIDKEFTEQEKSLLDIDKDLLTKAKNGIKESKEIEIKQNNTKELGNYIVNQLFSYLNK